MMGVRDMFYFKDDNGGVGIAAKQQDIGEVTWITEQEFNELLEILKEQEECAECSI